jgi:hypothetical protein
MFADAIAQQVRSAESSLGVAETLLGNYAVAQALERYREARAAVAELGTDERYCGADAARAAVESLTPRLDAFAQRYAREQLADEARDLLASVASAEAELERLAKRGLGQSAPAKAALDKLAALAAGAGAGGDAPLLLQCAGVAEALERVRAARVAAAQAEHGELLRRSIASAQRAIDSVVLKHIERGLVELAVEAFNERVRAPFAAALLGSPDVAASVALLADYADFVERAEALCAERLRGRTRLVASSSSSAADGGDSGASSSSSDPQTLLDVIGGSLEPAEPLKMATVPLSVDINPKLYNEVKELNTLAGRINTEARKAVRAIKEMPFGASATLKMLADGHYATDIDYRENAGYPIESIVTSLKKAQQQVASAVREAPDDETTLKLKANVDTFAERWAATYGRWTQLKELGAEMRSVLQTIDFARCCLNEGLSCYKSNSNPNAVQVSHRALIMGDVKGMGQFAPKMYDYDVFLFVIDRVRAVRAQIERAASRHDGRFARRAQLEAELDELYAEARRVHPLHCMRAYIFMAGNKDQCRRLYVRALRRFPLARAALRRTMAARKRRFYERREHELAECKHKQWLVDDPFGGVDAVKDRFEDEIAEEYELSYRIVQPGPGAVDDGDGDGKELPLANRDDQSTSERVYNALRKARAGQIVFSSAGSIDANEESDAAFGAEFDANDQVFGRAYWPRALANYALGVDKASGKPLYGPKYIFSSSHGHADLHYVEFLLFVSVDGERVERLGQPGNAFAYFRDNGARGSKKSYRQGSCVDFWSFNQTCRLQLGADAISDASDDWLTAANRLRRHYKSLSAGKHRVDVELCYRVLTTDDNLERRGPGKEVFPLHDTPISTPIARGHFDVNVADPAAVRLGTMFAPRSDACTLARPLATKNEQLIKRWLAESGGWGARASKTEEPLYVALEGNWYVCTTRYFEHTISNFEIKLKKEPTQYGLPCVAYFYRSPQTGWARESIAAFHLSALAPETRNPSHGPPFVGVSVGTSFSFDVDLLPDNVIATIKKRASEKQRQGALIANDKFIQQELSSSSASSSSSAAASSS